MSNIKRELDKYKSAQEWHTIACDAKHFYNINKTMRHKCPYNKKLMETHALTYWTASLNYRKMIRAGQYFNIPGDV